MRKRYKIILIIIVFFAFLISGLTIYMKFFRNQESKDTNKSNVVHNIKEYGYSLDDRDSELMKEEFYALEDILGSDEVDYQEYAKSLSTLFIIDLFTINNKINKYDVGGIEYLLENEQEKFKSIIMDSIYSTVLDNSNHNRSQELPVVKSVTVNNINQETYKAKEEMLDAYVVDINWEYEKDLGYDAKALITLIKEDKQLFIVEYSPYEDTEEEISE